MEPQGNSLGLSAVVLCRLPSQPSLFRGPSSNVVTYILTVYTVITDIVSDWRAKVQGKSERPMAPHDALRGDAGMDAEVIKGI